jgi:hypothetical protein
MFSLHLSLSHREAITVLYAEKNQYQNLKQIFPEKELRGHSPNFHIYVSLSDLYIPTILMPILLQEICGPILGIHCVYRLYTHECENWD